MTVRSSADPIGVPAGASVDAGSVIRLVVTDTTSHATTSHAMTSRDTGSPEPARMHDGWPSLERVFDLAFYAPVGAALVLREQLPKRARQRRQAVENRVQLARFIGRLAVQTGQREIAKRLAEQRLANSAAIGAAHDEARHEARHEAHDEAHHEAATTGDPARARPKLRAVPRADERSVSSAPAGPSAASETSAAADHRDVPTADHLPISDYESLAAIHVVERLRSMHPDEIESIRRFELAHRSRRTILAKIEQLQDR